MNGRRIRSAAEIVAEFLVFVAIVAAVLAAVSLADVR